MHVLRSAPVRLAVGFVATVMLLATMTGIASAQPGRRPDRTDEPPAQVLDRDRHGEDAIRALGDRLPEVAAMNGKTAAELRSALRQDPELWVGRTGRLLFVDGHLAEAATTVGPESAPLADAPLSETFLLHSRPGADRVIYLDFDGHDSTGSGWDSSDSESVAAPYSQDGDPTTFNDNERATIQSIWKRVAEDYAPFDIDVTTEDPGVDAIRRDSTSDLTYGTRLVITPTKTYNCSCGGVAYVGVFDATGSSHDYYQPAWVFTSGVGTGAKTVAEAASHEIGHNLGLSHDGTTSSGYYTGQGSWAPIMGVGYYEAITQWSQGDYAGASNTEDDFAVMRSHGAPQMTDDHGDTAATATGLTGTTVSLDGLIHSATDVDAFSFTTSGGAVSLHATPAPVSPDLDISLTLRDEAGTVVASADPPSSSSGSDSASGLDASIDLTVAAGTYTVLLDGVGAGDPLATGYSDYGSVGRYTLSGTLPATDPATAQPPAAPSGVSATASADVVTVTWTDNSDNETGFEIVREFLHKNGRWQGTTVVGSVSADATSFDDTGVSSGTYRYRVRAVNAVGAAESPWTGPVDVTGSGGGGGGGGGKPSGKGNGKGGKA